MQHPTLIFDGNTENAFRNQIGASTDIQSISINLPGPLRNHLHRWNTHSRKHPSSEARSCARRCTSLPGFICESRMHAAGARNAEQGLLAQVVIYADANGPCCPAYLRAFIAAPPCAREIIIRIIHEATLLSLVKVDKASGRADFRRGPATFLH